MTLYFLFLTGISLIPKEIRLRMLNARSSNIFLTGFMGAGKSTVGRALAQQVDCRFADFPALPSIPVPPEDRAALLAAFRESIANVLAIVTSTSA